MVVRRVAVGDVEPSPFQPRRRFDPGALERLASSIRSAGVMQPVLVRPRTAGAGEPKFELIAGERRWRAARLAGLSVVPAVVAPITDAEAAEWALIENLQREELGPLERAWALRLLCERFALTHQQAADKVGLDRSSVTNLIRLTELEPGLATLIDEGKLTIGHGKALLALPAGPGRESIGARAAAQGWSVRRLERESASQRQTPPGPEAQETPARGLKGGNSSALERSAQVREVEKRLSEHLGTRVQVSPGPTGTRGRIVISFYDLDHFDDLMSRLGVRL